MIEVNGWWMPHKGDHFVVRAKEFLTKAGYQSPQRKLSLEKLANKRTALDVGAHVGLWSRDLVKHFEKVIAFEPIAEHRECLKKNVLDENLEIRSVALGEFIGTTDFKYYKENSGKTHRIDGDKYDIVTIDSLNLNDVDYIKIDVEGFEKQVIMGAHETIQRCHPRIVIEIKKLDHIAKGQELDAQNHLLSIGYKKFGFHGADHIFDWVGQ
jgi:FkbM family methyltransferase